MANKTKWLIKPEVSGLKGVSLIGGYCTKYGLNGTDGFDGDVGVPEAKARGRKIHRKGT